MNVYCRVAGMIGGQWVVSVVMTSELDIVRDCDETGTRGDGGASV